MSMVTEPPLEAEGPARDTVAAYARRWWTDVKAGELGSLPIIVGLIVICIVFQTQNDRFLTAGNFVNLIVQTAPYAVIAMGVTFALLLGEIDLSIGFVSGVGGVLVALLLAPDGNEMATAPAIALALLAGLGIGLLHGLIITKVGVPSFVVTLAGLLAWNGVVLLLIGSRGTVILQNDFVVGLANDFMDPGLAWVLWAVTIALYAAIHVLRIRSRRKAGLANDPWVIEVLRIGGLALVLAVAIAVANQDRGVPYVGILVGALLVFWTYILNRTRFGRHVYAVGGSAEAARRAGINVDRVKIACFMLCSVLSGFAGMIQVLRLGSPLPSIGEGLELQAVAAAVIGGASLSGGIGTVAGGIIGTTLIRVIDNGLVLSHVDANWFKFAIGMLTIFAVVANAWMRKRARAIKMEA